MLDPKWDTVNHMYTWLVCTVTVSTKHLNVKHGVRHGIHMVGLSTIRPAPMTNTIHKLR